jgi:hypothetical protein
VAPLFEPASALGATAALPLAPGAGPEPAPPAELQAAANATVARTTPLGLTQWKTVR